MKQYTYFIVAVVVVVIVVVISRTKIYFGYSAEHKATTVFLVINFSI